MSWRDERAKLHGEEIRLSARLMSGVAYMEGVRPRDPIGYDDPPETAQASTDTNLKELSLWGADTQ